MSKMFSLTFLLSKAQGSLLIFLLVIQVTSTMLWFLRCVSSPLALASSVSLLVTTCSHFCNAGKSDALCSFPLASLAESLQILRPPFDLPSWVLAHHIRALYPLVCSSSIWEFDFLRSSSIIHAWCIFTIYFKSLVFGKIKYSHCFQRASLKIS